jgi:hypothetical protein
VLDPHTLQEAVDRQVAELERAASVGIRARDEKARRLLAAGGFIGVLPLWREAAVVVGLQAEPGADTLDWRGLIIKDRQALTLAANARTLLPRFLLLRFLSNTGSSLEELASEWPSIHPTFEALQTTLGGESRSLTAVAGVLGDRGRRAELTINRGGAEVYQRAMSRIAREIDRSPEFVAFADWLDRAVAGEVTPPPASQLGPWTRQSVCWARKLLDEQRRDLIIDADAAVEVIEWLGGVDAGVPRTPTWELRPGSDSSVSGLLALADKLEPARFEADPIRAGIVKALQTEALSYRGMAHAEAVPILDEAGQPERAWCTLNAAMWWMAQGRDPVPPAMPEGARMLCDRNGWNDILWVVEQNRGEK